MLFNKNNLLVADVASKEKARPEITGVLFKKDRTVATDSYILMEVKNPDNFNKEVNDFPETPDKSKPLANFSKTGYIIPANSVKKVLSNLPVKPNLPILNNALFVQPKTPDNSNIVTTDLAKADIVSVKNIDGNFPNYKQIIPNETGRKRVTINVEYLSRITGLISKMNLNTDKAVDIYVGGEEKPVMIKTRTKENQDVTAIIMPIRR